MPQGPDAPGSAAVRARLSQKEFDHLARGGRIGVRRGVAAVVEPAVAERLQRLERDEVIVGYHARLNPRALGLALSAVIRVRPAPRQLHEVGDIARVTPEIVDCRRITGEDCYVMSAHVRSVEHLEEVIDRFTPYGQTTTSIVQSAPVAPRGLPLDPDGA